MAVISYGILIAIETSQLDIEPIDHYRVFSGLQIALHGQVWLRNDVGPLGPISRPL